MSQTKRCFAHACSALKKDCNINTIYDIGAHKGDWTSEHSEIFKDIEFHMFEANPNLDDPVNGHSWHNVALSNKNEERIFYVRNSTGDSFYREQSIYYGEEAQRLKVQSITLDDYISRKGIRSPDAIKIDTQGSELDILRGAKKCLKTCKLLMMEQPILPYNQGAPSFDQYMAMALSNGFIPVGLEEMHIIDGAFVQIDVLFAKKDIYERHFMRYGFLQSAITSFSDANSKTIRF